MKDGQVFRLGQVDGHGLGEGQPGVVGPFDLPAHLDGQDEQRARLQRGAEEAVAQAADVEGEQQGNYN